MALELVPSAVLRALRYIDLLNRYGASPSADQIDVFAASDGPRGGTAVPLWLDTSLLMMGEFLAKAASGFTTVNEAEKVSDYLVRMDWTTVGSEWTYRMTPLGRAFLAGARQEEAELSDQDSLPRTVVLDPQGSMSEIELAHATSNAGAGMLLDPYVKPGNLVWLVGSTKITRVLIKPPREGLGAHEIALGHIKGAERIDLRVTESTEFHDRAIVGDDGSVTIVGASLNGIGRHLTTLVTLPPEDSHSLRKRFELLFEKGEPVNPARTDGKDPSEA